MVSTHGTLFNMWQPGCDENLGENGHKGIYGWVCLLSIFTITTLLIGYKVKSLSGV